MKRFDTCFFEGYAQITLETVLGDEFADLVNKDRPDLQKPDKSLGIEVTRAMEASKEVAKELLKEMAGMEVHECDKEEMGKIISSGYGYGLFLRRGSGLGYLSCRFH